eukprot:SAG31_NODE_6971_length_1831_cov_1.136836_2_plen_273_part_00
MPATDAAATGAVPLSPSAATNSRARPARQRKAPVLFEAGPASGRHLQAAADARPAVAAETSAPAARTPTKDCMGAGPTTAGGHAGRASTPRRTPTKQREAGAVVAVRPAGSDEAFWLARVDSQPGMASAAACRSRRAKHNSTCLPVTWLEPVEPTDEDCRDCRRYVLGSKQRGGIDRATVLCTVRPADSCSWAQQQPLSSSGSKRQGAVFFKLTAEEALAIEGAIASATAAEDAACVAAAAGRRVIQVDGLPGSGEGCYFLVFVGFFSFLWD